MKTKFIINPIAGTGKQLDITNKIKKLLEKDRFNFDVDITKRPNHATELSKKAIKENYELVVAIGGDGTVSECAKALIGSETALSIIPCGSGNGFAYHFNINRKIDDAILQLNNNQIKYIDSCIVNNFPFINVSGIGFDAHIANLFASTKKRGFFSYIKLTLRELSYKAKEYEICYNSISKKIKAFAIVFANASQYGNDARIAPNAITNDGLIDFVIVKKFPNWKIPFFILDVLRGKTHLNKNVEILKLKELTIKTDNKIVHLDGEVKKVISPISIKISDRKLKIFVP